MHALCVGGTRPNLVKLGALIPAFEAVGVRTTFVHTGQHYDAAMSDVLLEELCLREPEHDLGVGSGTHVEQISGVMSAFEPVLAEVEPDVVVVVGDVNSTVACALVTATAGVPLAHVEAGLRSRDWSMPEEVNRVVTDRVSNLLFAPSRDAVGNLGAEGSDPRRVHFVGNVMIDTLLANVDRAMARTVLTDLGLTAGHYGVVTLHRPANVDDPARFRQLVGALSLVGTRLPLVLPAHPRARARLAAAEDLRGSVTLVEPLGYLDFVALQASAAVVITDSGGVQEETTVLGVPCLTLRSSTERPVTVSEGTNTLVATADPAVIAAAVDSARAAPRRRHRPELWDGRASQRVAEVLTTLDSGEMPRPSE